MKKLLSILLFLFVTFPFLGFKNAFAGNTDILQKGITISPISSTDFSSQNFLSAIKDAKATNANYVTLIIPLMQDNLTTSQIHNVNTTPTDASLISAINTAHKLGIHIMLKPIIDVATGDWRAYINPADPNAWFLNFGNILNHYVTIAKNNNVDEICIGTEMSTLSTNSTYTNYWNTLISNIRSNYSGRLTYSANWGTTPFYGEMEYVTFWSKLDYIGISQYFPLTNHGDASVNELQNAWIYWGNIVNQLHSKYNLPVLFTEAGYRSLSKANVEPWNSTWAGANDEVEQANDYIAMFTFWNQYSWMKGYQIVQWNTDPQAGGWQDTSYTPQKKLAQDVLTTWFSNGTLPSYSFNISGNFSQNIVNKSQQVTGFVNVKDTGTIAHGMIVDIVIYDSSNNVVLQKFFPDEVFYPGQTKGYNIQFTPSSSGSYRIASGIFNSNWSQNYSWNDNVAKLLVN